MADTATGGPEGLPDADAHAVGIGAEEKSLRTAFPLRPFLVAMVLALALALVTFLVNPVASSFSSDDGAYGLEVRSLVEDEGWSVPHVLAPVDPDGLTYPYVNSAITDAGFFPGARHVVWSAALALPAQIFGPWGMRGVLAVAFAVAIAFTAKLAAAAGRPATGGAALLLAASSPLFFNSLQLWAHTAAAAAIAVASVGALWVMDGRRDLVAFVALGFGCAAAGAIRGDGAVFAVAVGTVVVASAIRGQSWSRAAAGMGALASAVGGYILAARLGTAVVGSSAAVGAGESRATEGGRGRWLGFAHTFFGTNEDPGAFLLMAAATVLVAGAAWSIRRQQPDHAVGLIVAAGTLWLVRTVLFTSATATGLIGAWPVVLLIGARSWRSFSDGERRLLAVVALGAVGITATQYDVGGGANWGGRFVACAIPALAVLITGGLSSRPSLEGLRSSPVVAAVAVLSVVGLLASWSLDMRIRANFVAAVRPLDALDEGVPIVTSARHLPRADWGTQPRRPWLLVPEGPEGANEVRRLLDRANIDAVAFYLIRPDLAEDIVRGDLDFAEVKRGLVMTPEVEELR